MSFGKEDPTYRGLGSGRSRKLVIEMDGTSDYVEVGNHSVFNFTSGGGSDNPFSLSAWVQTTSSNDQGAIISKNSGNGVPSNWLLYHNQGQVQALIYDGSGSNLAAIRAFTQSSGLLPPGQWSHVIMTYDGSKSQNGINLYINGQLQSVTRSNPSPYSGLQATASPVRIGANAAGGVGNEFEKYITECVVYDFEVNSSEAVELYNQGRPFDMVSFSRYSDLVSWWRMGDGDSPGADGIIDGVGSYSGTLEGDAKIVAVRDL
tara:strand:+ start:8375 stop:9157 length:783 start_codon:yes stop_codon:yes gene_type:complete